MDKDLLADMIKEWIQIENELVELRKAAKERRIRKKELTDNLVDVMKENEIDEFNVNGSKLIYTKRKTRTALSKKHLLNVLHHYYRDEPERAAELTNFILESREEKVNETIRHKQ